VINEIDPAVPRKVLERIKEEQPRQETWSDDLKILLDPNIRARSLNLPMVGAIRILNQDYRYRWVHIRRGSNPDTTRYMQLKAYGFENATAWDFEKNPSGDVEVKVADIGTNFTEIFSGDRILMKCPRAVYDGLMKQHMLDAIAQTTRARSGMYQDLDPARRMNAMDDGTMKSANFGPGAPTSRTDFSGNQSGDIDLNQVLQRSNPGNTSVVKPQGRK
jgi:hypothetical protein